MIFSVIVPTFNRRADLERVLAALAEQQMPAAWSLEVVVVDDGSSDGTWQFLKRWRGPGGPAGNSSPGENREEVRAVLPEGRSRSSSTSRTSGRADRASLAICSRDGVPGRASRRIAVRQANAGPAKARNVGVRAASGELIAFLGDDTIPQDYWALEHVETHRLAAGERPVAVLGYTSFPTEHETPFLRWINEFGAQFGYSIIEDPGDVPFNFFYTSNISLPRQLFLDFGGFREDFPAAAWEDIEFAYRATRAGMRIVYQARARTLHHHRIRPRTFCRRQRTAGQSGAIFAGLHPELQPFLGLPRLGEVGWRAVVESWFLLPLTELGERIPGVVPSRVYKRLLDHSYLKGLAEGLHSPGRG